MPSRSLRTMDSQTSASGSTSPASSPSKATGTRPRASRAVVWQARQYRSIRARAESASYGAGAEP